MAFINAHLSRHLEFFFINSIEAGKLETFAMQMTRMTNKISKYDRARLNQTRPVNFLLNIYMINQAVRLKDQKFRNYISYLLFFFSSIHDLMK